VTTTTPATKPAQLNVGDKVTFKSGATVAVLSYEQPAPAMKYTKPDDGMEYARIDVEVCAGSAETSYNGFGFELQTADNRRWDNGFGVDTNPDLGSGDLPANGGCVRGFVGFELPAGQRPVSVVFDYPGFEQARWMVPAA
jgi:hypothetical protein